MGINMPNMGTRAKSRVPKIKKHTSPADALFSTIEQRLLAVLIWRSSYLWGVASECSYSYTR
jgi:hypothetical protein